MAKEKEKRELGSPMSLRAFARFMGVDEKAVRKAVASGRLKRAVARLKWRTVITDRWLAQREWHDRAAAQPYGRYLERDDQKRAKLRAYPPGWRAAADAS